MASSAFSLSSREDRSRVLEMCSLRCIQNVGHNGYFRAGMSVRCRPGPRPSASGKTYTVSLLFAYLLQAIHNDAYWEQLGYMSHPHKPPPLRVVAQDRLSRRMQIHDTQHNQSPSNSTHTTSSNSSSVGEPHLSRACSRHLRMWATRAASLRSAHSVALRPLNICTMPMHRTTRRGVIGMVE